MNSTRMSINHKTLAETRVNLGFSLDAAAKKIGVKSLVLASWESGEKKPTYIQLMKASRTYGLPSAYFFGDNVYAEEQPPDFRSFPDILQRQIPEIRLEIRYARERRETAIELLSELDEDIPYLEIPALKNSESLTKVIRDVLGIQVDTQMKWSNPYEALNKWCLSFEKAGIIVFQFSGIDVDTMRGFCLNERPLPVIGLNIKDSPHARIFTLFHELRHLVFREGGICDLHDSGHEKLCNEFAGEFLVPDQDLLRIRAVRTHTGVTWETSELNELSRIFSVSQEVILRRLLSLGLTTKSFYQQFRVASVEKSRRPSSRGYMSYTVRLLKENGAFFTNLLVSSYDAGVISSVDVSSSIRGAKIEYLEKLRKMIRG